MANLNNDPCSVCGGDHPLGRCMADTQQYKNWKDDPTIDKIADQMYRHFCLIPTTIDEFCDDVLELIEYCVRKEVERQNETQKTPNKP